jgi:hypothetical protein
MRIFSYTPPRFHLTAGQRLILVRALDGATDIEIAEGLKVSPDAIKKRWSAIYARVEEVMPGLLPEAAAPRESGSRGTEKRRALLAYLRRRPEELRAFEP